MKRFIVHHRKLDSNFTRCDNIYTDHNVTLEDVIKWYEQEKDIKINQVNKAFNTIVSITEDVDTDIRIMEERIDGSFGY